MPDEVRAGYRDGKFTAADLAWRDGMPMWKPLGEVIDEIAPAAGEGVELPPPVVKQQNGPAWEQRAQLGFVKALLETIRAVLLEPTATFATMRQTGDFGGPLLFAVMLGWVAFVVTFFYQMIFQSLGLASSEGEKEMFAVMFGSAVVAGVLIVLVPVFIAAGAFLGAGLTHLMLMIVGGAKRPFESTFRVLCYASGSTAVLQLLPMCGGLVASVWMLVAEIIGLSEVHGITRMRAAVAVLLPLIVCCGLIAVVVVIALGVGMGASMAK